MVVKVWLTIGKRHGCLDGMTPHQCLAAPAPVPPSSDAPWQEWVHHGLAWSRHPVASERACAQPTSSWAAKPARQVTFHSYREATPGSRWQVLFDATWPAYRSWYTAHDLEARPSLAEARAALGKHMPELLTHWERLVELAGADPLAARMLTMWRMPAIAAGCSQAVVPGNAPLLVRNYDYDPHLFEGVVASTNYSGQRRVIGTSDLLWGLVDGMNEDGLAVSLTLGGSPDSGDGFGIPIVIRYLLETCPDVESAIAALCESGALDDARVVAVELVVDAYRIQGVLKRGEAACGSDVGFGSRCGGERVPRFVFLGQPELIPVGGVLFFQRTSDGHVFLLIQGGEVFQIGRKTLIPVSGSCCWRP